MTCERQHRSCRWWLLSLLGGIGWLATSSVALSQSSLANDSAAQRFAGYASCLARGCHGGPDVRNDGSMAPAALLNAATVWINHDRHATAYRTLLSPRSKDILRRLAGSQSIVSAVDVNDPHPEREERCLACHTTPSLASRELNDVADIESVRSEGVSCDACHTSDNGDSWRWVDAHPRGLLKTCLEDPSRGMRSLKTAAQRAQVCAGCHVGAPANGTIPFRDMNHDLIAAGHPRFFFDYATYLQLLPPHWQERSQPTNPQSRLDPTGELAAAVIGQTALLSAELALEADRARRTGWAVDFSSLDCYGCHHDLQADSWRRELTSRERSGRPKWLGTELLGSSRAWILPAGESAASDFAKVADVVGRFQAPEAALLNGVDDWLQKWLHGSAEHPLPTHPADVDAMLPSWPLGVGPNPQSPAGLTWDQAARRFYLAQEMDRIRRRVLSQPAVADDAPVDEALRKLRDSLSYRRQDQGFASPKSYRPQESAALYNTARNLVVERWVKALGQRTSLPDTP